MNTKVILLTLAGGLLPQAAQAGTVTANFTDGNTSAAVDGYAGMAGNGWGNGWGANGGGTFRTQDVINTSPLHGGGNYLSYGMTKGPSENIGAIQRRWDTTVIPLTAVYRVSFDLRVDTPDLHTNASDTNSRVFIFGDTGNSAGSTSASTTWSIQTVYNSGDDTVYWGYTDNSGTVVSTGVAVTTDVMHFIVDVDPVNFTYSFNLTDYNNPAIQYTKTNAGFRNDVAGLNKIFFGIGADKDRTDTGVSYSLDSLVITDVIPEPTSLGLLGAGCGLMCLHRHHAGR